MLVAIRAARCVRRSLRRARRRRNAAQGGAGFIGSHATLRLLSDGHTVTIVVRRRCSRARPGCAGAAHAARWCRASAPALTPPRVGAQDNLSRGNQGAVDALKRHVPAAATHLRFVKADLGVREQVRCHFTPLRILLAPLRRRAF